MWAMRASTVLLAAGASARLSRLVITDKIGRWWIHEPIDRAMAAYADREVAQADADERDVRVPWWWRYRDGLDCPFCVGFWLTAAVVVTGAAADRAPGRARTAWRLGAGVLAANYVVAHIGARLGDFEDQHDETDETEDEHR